MEIGAMATRVAGIAVEAHREEHRGAEAEVDLDGITERGAILVA